MSGGNNNTAAAEDLYTGNGSEIEWRPRAAVLYLQAGRKEDEKTRDEKRDTQHAAQSNELLAAHTKTI